MTNRLIIVRAGDASLHTNWGRGNWDLINASYSDNPPADAMAIKGGKWDGIYKVFQARPALLQKYKTFWFPDDDIETNAVAIEKFFALHEQYALQLSQPALTHDSYYWFAYLLQNKNFLLRYTNFIEAMVPCFDIALLKKVLPLFEGNRTGYMMDKVWHRFALTPHKAAAVIDSVAVKHARALNPGILDFNYKGTALKEGEINKSSQAQDKKIIEAFLPPRKKCRPLCYGAVLTSGKKIEGERRLVRYFLSPFNRKQVRYQLTARADLTPLERT